MHTSSTITTSQTTEPVVVMPAEEAKKLHVHRSTWAVVALSGWALAALSTVGYYDVAADLKVANATLVKPTAARFVSDDDLAQYCPGFMKRDTTLELKADADWRDQFRSVQK